MPELKLVYFPVKGRIEPSRIMLNYAGRKFTDVRVERANWPELKPNTPMGSLPYLDIDGSKTRLCQSMTINRYIARETDLAGKDSLQQAQVDMISTTANEYMDSMNDIVSEPDPAKKADLEETRNNVTVPKILRFFESCLEKNVNSGGFLVGKSVTLADFISWHVLEYMLAGIDTLLDAYPKLKENRQVVSNLPKFAEYLKKRPQTQY